MDSGVIEEFCIIFQILYEIMEKQFNMEINFFGEKLKEMGNVCG